MHRCGGARHHRARGHALSLGCSTGAKGCRRYEQPAQRPLPVLLPITVAMMMFILAPLLVTVAICSQHAVRHLRRAASISIGIGRPCKTRIFRNRCVYSLLAGATSGDCSRPGGVCRHPPSFGQNRCDGASVAAGVSGADHRRCIAAIVFDDEFQQHAPNMLIAHVLVTMPYVARTVSARSVLADTTLEDARANALPATGACFAASRSQIAPGFGGRIAVPWCRFDNFPISRGSPMRSTPRSRSWSSR